MRFLSVYLFLIALFSLIVWILHSAGIKLRDTKVWELQRENLTSTWKPTLLDQHLETFVDVSQHLWINCGKRDQAIHGEQVLFIIIVLDKLLSTFRIKFLQMLFVSLRHAAGRRPLDGFLTLQQGITVVLVYSWRVREHRQRDCDNRKWKRRYPWCALSAVVLHTLMPRKFTVAHNRIAVSPSISKRTLRKRNLLKLQFL